MLKLSQKAVQYPELKTRLIRNTLIWSALVTGILLIVYPKVVRPYVLGALLGYAYLFSLFLSVESPKRVFTIIISMIRMAIVSFLIVWIGQFRLLEIGVAFCGFLSYKIVLVLEFIRYSVEIKE